MSNKYEIWIIIILVLGIVITHSVPILINNTEFYTIIERVNNTKGIPWPKIEPERLEKIVVGNKIGRKYNINSFDLDIDSFDFEETECIRTQSDCTVLKSEKFSEYVNDILDIPNDHFLYLVKVDPGHTIKEGKMELMHNFNGNLKEIKSIWYLFLDLELGFEDGWVFRDIEHDTYHMPEKNCIIEFGKDDCYEMMPLKSKESKYFVIILNF